MCLGANVRNKVSLSAFEKLDPCRRRAVECCLVYSSLCDSAAVDLDARVKPVLSPWHRVRVCLCV